MNKLQMASPGSACTSCTSSCSVNRLLSNFPLTTQRKLDDIVLSIGRFNSEADGKKTVDERMIQSFKGIIAKVTAIMEADSPSMPELEGALTALIEREGGPQFKYLFEQVMR